MKNKLLTIGIPTYNGSETICDAIDSVVSQLDDELLKKVDILVSNNKSTDDTVKKVSGYIDKLPNHISLIDNDTPELELDGNLINLFKHANGEYLWILSDDDALEDASIKKVISVIEKQHDLSLIFTNYSECDVNLNILSKRDREDIEEDIYCENGNEFFINSKVLFGLISALIIRTDDWNQSDLKKYIGLNSLHIGAIIEILSHGKSYVISDKLVRLRIGNTSWGKNGTFIFPILNIVKMFKEIKHLNYPLSSYHYLTDYFFTVNYKALIRAKIDGLKDFKKAFVEMKACYGHKKRFWLLDVFIIITPRSVLIFLNNLRNKLVKGL